MKIEAISVNRPFKQIFCQYASNNYKRTTGVRFNRHQGRCQPEINEGDKPSDENLQKFRLFQEGMVWEASPTKFRNFGINLVHSGVYSGGFFVEMGT